MPHGHDTPPQPSKHIPTCMTIITSTSPLLAGKAKCNFVTIPYSVPWAVAWRSSVQSNRSDVAVAAKLYFVLHPYILADHSWVWSQSASARAAHFQQIYIVYLFSFIPSWIVDRAKLYAHKIDIGMSKSNYWCTHEKGNVINVIKVCFFWLLFLLIAA